MEADRSAELRNLPSVDRVLGQPSTLKLIDEYGRQAATEAIQEALQRARAAVQQGEAAPSPEQVVSSAAGLLRELSRPTLRPVINATGVILHTNLGRAPLSTDARASMETVGGGYSNLEFDLGTGERGSRHDHAARLLCRLTGAEAALVVNNNAAAVLLCLTALARGREVVISRGQLVEIGGGFRVPDVMRQSGCRLVEVGTTNRTYLRDYEQALSPDTALLLWVHTSNFRVDGFTYSATLQELAGLGRERNLPVMCDLGSGTLLDTTAFGMAHEPTVQECVSAGADLVTFSGDKLLGGPQAGLIVGTAGAIRSLRTHPLLRALRVDKATLAGLEATLRHYLKGEALEKVPVWRMISMPLAAIRERAERWASTLVATGADASTRDGQSTVGGGSLPGETLPTVLVRLRVGSPDTLARALRLGDPAVVARIEGDRVVLDPRTVREEAEKELLAAVVAALPRPGR